MHRSIRRFNGAAALLLRKCEDRTHRAMPHFASMGPQHCCCGNRPTSGPPQLYAAASMGPQHCCCGNRIGKGRSERNYSASMGPQHCCCGNGALPATRLRPDQASMGPQHCCCGNAAPSDQSSIGQPMLQWGRSIAAAEMDSAARCYCDLIMLQWGRSIAAAEMSRWSTSSARTTTLQWGRSIAAAEIVRLVRLARHDGRASMGPQHCCCGNQSWPIMVWPVNVASMGPQHCCCGNKGRAVARNLMAQLQWGRSIAAAEIIVTATFRSMSVTLQWGRSIAAAEIVRLVRLARHDGRASMGPQHCCCGNQSWPIMVWPVNVASMGPQHCCCGNKGRAVARNLMAQLQWGRSIAAAEIPQWGHDRFPRVRGFNGAAALLLRKLWNRFSYI